ncbi:MAG: zinc ribbon domain-containing protein [Clostridia bacterium]|nr:zinc ribbon domain-containing protein [Clostridia bacterium]
MALIEFVCPKCGYESEELVRSDGVYPNCPQCGEKLKQKLNGKCYTNCAGKSGGGCSGNCSCCGGCHK